MTRQATSTAPPSTDPLGPDRRRAIARAARAELARRSLAEFIRQSWHVTNPGVKYEHGRHVDVIAAHVQRQLEDWARARIDPTYVQPGKDLVIGIPPRCLKPCYDGGIVVEKTRGNILLRDVAVGDSVLTHAGRFRRVTAVQEQGELPLWEVRTSRGRVIKVAGDHPLLTQRGWVRADQITTRDVLAEVHAIEECGTRTITDRESRLIGYLVGDGCLSQNFAARFTNADPETLADFTECASALGFSTATRPIRNTWTVTLKDGDGTKRRPRGTCGPVRGWLRRRGMERTSSYTKRVPDAVMSGDREVIVQYLAAYWACDGGIHDRRDLPRSRRRREHGTSSVVRISATTVSEGLARDHQALLSRLGLSFRIRRHANGKIRSRKQDGPYVSWDVVAADQDTAAKFMQVIGPHIRHEKGRRAADLERTSFDRVLVPDPVVSVEQVGVGECRCLEVEEDHSFTFEGVAVHNSTIVAVCATAWAWLHWPGIKIGCLSVNPRVSFRDALAARALMLSDWYQQSFAPTWSIRDDQNAVGNFANTAGGSRNARGFDSNVVGEGFDWLIVDDPHDPRDSTAAVAKVLDGWDVAVGSRVTDARVSIRTGIMHRVTEGDFSDHVLKQGWAHLCLPMEFEPERVTPGPYSDLPTEWRVVAGESLHPDRFPPPIIEQIKVERGSYAYAAQYQQRPAPLGGGMIQRAWFKRFTMAEAPKFDWTTISVDATFGSVAEDADNVGLLVVAGAGPLRFVLCDASRKMSFLDTIAAIKALMVTYPHVKRVLVEKAAAGGPITEVLRREIGAGVLRTVVIEEINPRDHGKKVDRVVASLPQLESGMVHLLEGAHWVDAFLGEHGLFPNGQHDDRVDALSQLLIRYGGSDVRDRWKALSRG